MKAAMYAFTLRFGVQGIWQQEYEENAVKHAQIAISIDPTLGYAHTALGLAHEANLNGPAARREFERSYELSPNDPAVLTSYGRFLRSIGQYDAAIRAGERAVELDPNNRQYLHLLGVSYLFARRYSDAKNAYTRALRLVPDSIPSRLALAIAMGMLGEREAALNELQVVDQLMADTPNFNVFVFAQRVTAYRLAGRDDLAATAFKAFENSAAETRTGPTMWAMAYAGLRDFENALKELEKATQDPDSVESAPLVQMKANVYGDPELDSPEFKAALDRLGFNFPDETT
jgi:tetratricopeptide (TPR) repeat protein